jgi:hypothetical protein
MELAAVRRIQRRCKFRIVVDRLGVVRFADACRSRPLAAMVLLGPPAGGIVAALSGLTADVMFYLVLGTFFAFAPLRSSGTIALRQTRRDGIAAHSVEP